ncbi:hypothetical protein [Kordiimonas pumila]|uniref:Uncharacterized protein n=1 Tax=Kordiimonas pumila TaxID=2161677 RepID=A0ABV7D496_9PROT|nr:hypothetical protein [Kordiimonas pumila]
MAKSLPIVIAAFVGALIGSALTHMRADYDQKLKILDPDIEGSERYSFALVSSISLDSSPSAPNKISLIQQNILATIEPENIQSLCLETKPYDGELAGEYELALKLKFTSESKEVFYKALQTAENEHLQLKFNYRTVVQGVLQTGSAERYRNFTNNYPDIFDMQFAALHGNHAGLLEFAHALSPNEIPGGCDENFDLEHINQEGQTTAKKIW